MVHHVVRPFRFAAGEPFAIVHSADLHLGSAMAVAARLGRSDDLAAATYEALDAVIDLVDRDGVRLLTLSGDLFDQADQANPAPRRRLATALGRVGDTAVAIVRGNHDHHKDGAPLPRYPDNVFEFRGDERTWDLGWVRVHGVSFDRQHVHESLLPRYPSASADHFNIGLLHANVGGRPGHDDYAPCTVTDLTRHGYRMWLLGHIHKREVLCADPLVLYPGNLQGRHARETGPRSVEKIEVDAAGGVTHAPVPVHSVLWHEEVVDLSDVHDLEDAMNRVIRAGERVRADLSRERGAIVRFRLVGATGVHPLILRQADAGEAPFEETLRDELNTRLGDLDPFLLTDRVVTRTRHPVDLGAARDAQDVLGVLARLAEDPATRERALTVLQEGPVAAADAAELLQRIWPTAVQGAVTRLLEGKDA